MHLQAEMFLRARMSAPQPHWLAQSLPEAVWHFRSTKDLCQANEGFPDLPASQCAMQSKWATFQPFHDSLDETCNLGVDTTLVPVADLFQAQPKFRFRLQGVAALQVLKCLRTLEPRLNHSPTLTPGVLWSWDAKERLTVLFNFFNFLFALLFRVAAPYVLRTELCWW